MALDDDYKLSHEIDGVKFVIGRHDEIVGAWDGPKYVPATEFDNRLKYYQEEFNREVR